MLFTIQNCIIGRDFIVSSLEVETRCNSICFEICAINFENFSDSTESSRQFLLLLFSTISVFKGEKMFHDFLIIVQNIGSKCPTSREAHLDTFHLMCLMGSFFSRESTRPWSSKSREALFCFPHNQFFNFFFGKLLKNIITKDINTKYKPSILNLFLK